MKEIITALVPGEKKRFKIKTAMNGQEALDQIMLDP